MKALSFTGLKNCKEESFLLATLTNMINIIHKCGGCKTENACVIISEKKGMQKYYSSYVPFTKRTFELFCPFLNLFQEGDSQHVMSEL